ncbi:hypothetical protein CD110_13260 [Staphylococcus casei]|uniref:hypothetical protein n=1 Tax=Staphylococcus casei TaxID=201828 RepID=UPI000CD104F6|nr:hypothetical protein [Staphylococcus casei]PNZ56783.1 hypothetical protein CD110_13260 [Staphylococcus casei]WJE85305.1 hypothetical protein QMO72_07710 [Staphylococcus casei]
MKNSIILSFLVGVIYIAAAICCFPLLFNNGNYITVVTTALPLILIIVYIVKRIKDKRNNAQ